MPAYVATLWMLRWFTKRRQTKRAYKQDLPHDTSAPTPLLLSRPRPSKRRRGEDAPPKRFYSRLCVFRRTRGGRRWTSCACGLGRLAFKNKHKCQRCFIGSEYLPSLENDPAESKLVFVLSSTCVCLLLSPCTDRAVLIDTLINQELHRAWILIKAVWGEITFGMNTNEIFWSQSII